MAIGDPVLTGSVITPAQNPVTADASFFVLAREAGRTVCHLGRLDPAPPADTNAAFAENLGPYTMNGISVPCHWWNARWTDRSSPIQVVKSPAQIVAARRMFPFAGSVPPQPARFPYTIMGSSSVVAYEPTTGESPQLGLVTDPSAYFMLGGDPGSMIDYALVGETCPIYFRDQSTGLPINLITYPGANAYDLPGRQGAPWLAKGPPTTTSGGYSDFGGSWHPQQAHHPEYCYLAHIATGDMGFLESLQYHGNFMLVADATLSSQLGKATPYGEYRGLAWTFRNLFMAHVATQDAEAAGTLPNYLLPSSYFKTLLDNALAYYGQAITNPALQIFHTIVGGTFAPWQCDYMLLALALGVLTGHTDWIPLFLWALKNAIDQLSGTSGYPPGWGGAYYLDGTQPSWAAAFNALQTNNQGGDTPSAAQLAALAADPFNGGVAMVGVEYLQSKRAVIEAARYIDNLGIAAVRAMYPNLDQCFAVVDKMVGPSTEPRHAIVSNSSVASVSIPPLTTGVTMSSTGTDPLSALSAAVTQIKADVAAEIAAIHARLAAIVAAAAGGTTIDPTELAAQVSALDALHTTLTADTAALPTATS